MRFEYICVCVCFIVNVHGKGAGCCLFAGLSPRMPGFDPRRVRVRFMGSEVVMGHVCFLIVWFSPVTIISPMLHIDPLKQKWTEKGNLHTEHCYFLKGQNWTGKHLYFFLSARDLEFIDSDHASWSSTVRFVFEIPRLSDILHWKFSRRFFRVLLYQMRTGFSFKRRRL